MSKLMRCDKCNSSGVQCENDSVIGKWNIQTLKLLIKRIHDPVRKARLLKKYRELKKIGRIPCGKCNGKGYYIKKERVIDIS